VKIVRSNKQVENVGNFLSNRICSQQTHRQHISHASVAQSFDCQLAGCFTIISVSSEF